MPQEERELLLKDLCARLPYGVQGITSEGIVSPLLTKGEADWDILTSLNYRIVKHGWKPYLRSISSMTEEEAEQIIKFICEDSIGINKINIKQDHITAKVDYLIGDSETVTVWFDDIIQSIEIFDFLNAHHFDYRGLIEKGLALEAPKDMYNIKTE